MPFVFGKVLFVFSRPPFVFGQVRWLVQVFNNDARVYTGTITKVKQLRNKTVYVCDYDDGDSVQHTEEELRVALRGE